LDLLVERLDGKRPASNEIEEKTARWTATGSTMRIVEMKQFKKRIEQAREKCLRRRIERVDCFNGPARSECHVVNGMKISASLRNKTMNFASKFEMPASTIAFF
jgi:hypothetical protein